MRVCGRFSLSPGERAGVRGNRRNLLIINVPFRRFMERKSLQAFASRSDAGSPPHFSKKLGSAPVPGAAADALVRRRERVRASSPRFFLNQHPEGVPALR